MKALVLALVVLVAGTTAAEATCLSTAFDDVVSSSQTVWWATVKGSAIVGGDEVLDVTVIDVLKGRGGAGSAGRVYFTSCGPVMTAAARKQAATSMVGRSYLFMGTLAKEVLSPDPAVVTPAGMSESERYERARVALGRTPPRSHRWVLRLALGIVAVLLVAAILARHQRTIPPAALAR